MRVELQVNMININKYKKKLFANYKINAIMASIILIFGYPYVIIHSINIKFITSHHHKNLIFIN